MVQVGQFPNFSPLSLVEYMVMPGLNACNNPVFNWLTFGRIPENPVITPNGNTQVVYPSAKNRYIQSVTVKPVSTTPLTVTPSTSVQTFTDGYYNPVTVNATA